MGCELEFAKNVALKATLVALLVSLLQSSSGSDLIMLLFTQDRQNIPVTPAPVLESSLGSLPTESADLIGYTGAWGKGRGRHAGLLLG